MGHAERFRKATLEPRRAAGENPIWYRFWENPGLTALERDRIIIVRERLQEDLEKANLDYGLIHADMRRENITIDDGELGLIDFDDCGLGYRLFDVATTLLKNRAEPDYPALENAMLTGYSRIRPLDTGLLPQFNIIRALSYLGWIIKRQNEPGAGSRQTRFKQTAMPLIEAYLATTP
ncbi:MAG: phosphotransferase [Pseudomonadota bacterium]